ncbi:MAG TPA: TRAP transporter small permease [Clostridiales bacterium]|nr:TRAP transporter small permease [Clostridiales bacterium]
MDLLAKISDRVNKYSKYFTACLLAALTVIITIQVISRRFLGSSLTWSEETARYIFIWIIMLGAASGLKEGYHVAITVLMDRLKGKSRKTLDIIVNICILFLAIFLLAAGVRLAVTISGQLSPAIRLNMFWVYLSVPISGAIMIIHLASEITQNVKGIFAGDSVHTAKDMNAK